MPERMLRANYKLQPGRVSGHGSWCADCKPDEPLGRSREKALWVHEARQELAELDATDEGRS